MNQPPLSQETLLLRTMAHALRHSPESHFLEMDADGWVELDQFLLAMQFAHPTNGGVSEETVRRLAGSGDAARFGISGNRIRALYGHSRHTTPIGRQDEPPVFLFHGTMAESLSAIREFGLRPMQRRSVHLSSNWHYANSVAQANDGIPVVLVVGAYRAAEAGVIFQKANGHVWLAAEVPTPFIIVPSPGQSGWGRDLPSPAGNPNPPQRDERDDLDSRLRKTNDQGAHREE